MIKKSVAHGQFVFLFKMATMICAALCAPQMARAAIGEWVPGFDLSICTNSASTIVVGQLAPDGVLTITKTLRAHAALPDSITLERGAETYRIFSAAIKQNGPLEVAAFLREPKRDVWPLTRGLGGIVAFAGETVYALDESGWKPGKVIQREEYSRVPFLRAVRDVVAVASQQQKILDLPRTTERARKIVGFIERHTLQRPEKIGNDESYRLAHGVDLMKLADALHEPSAQESQIIYAALEKSKKDFERVHLMELLGLLKPPPSAFEVVAPFIVSTCSPIIRRASMQTLPRIDSYRAAEYLARYLSWNEPELTSVLDSLYSDRNAPLSLQAAKSMEKLARSSAAQISTDHDRHLSNARYALIRAMSGYAHPHFVTLFYQNALAANQDRGEQAFADLQNLTGLKFSSEQKTEWAHWWQQAQPLLDADYALSTSTGRAQWYAAYAKADDATRKLLMRFWFFEPTPDEPALLAEATGANAELAKNVLATLWQANRLTPQARCSIVEKFLSVEFIEIPAGNPGYCELRIIGTPHFPFPSDAWVQFSSDVVFNEQLPNPDRISFGNSKSLQSSEPIDLGGAGTGSAGKTTANALMGMREFDYYGTRKVLWQLQWRLGPLGLHQTAAP